MIANFLACSAFSRLNSSQSFLRLSRCGGSWRSYGLNCALAGKGVLVLDKVFQNLKSSELFQKGATVAEFLSGFPIHVRGHAVQGSSEISKPQFTKLLKQACLLAFGNLCVLICSSAVFFFSSRTIPSASKLSGQAAYHFLAGYQNGKFVPAFQKGPSSIDPLELAKALLCMLKEQQIPSFLVNAKGIESESGKKLVTLDESIISKNIPPIQVRGGEIKRRYKSFLSGKYQQLPEDFSF